MISFRKTCNNGSSCNSDISCQLHHAQAAVELVLLSALVAPNNTVSNSD
jgi:hypothetical protein